MPEVTDDLANAKRTEEGWLVLHMEYRNDDPWVLDDCWHRGPYWRYSVPGTSIAEEGDAHEFKHVDAFDRVMGRLKAAGGRGVVEVVRTNTEAEPYRVIHRLDNYGDKTRTCYCCNVADLAEGEAYYCRACVESGRVGQDRGGAW